ncbi:oligosaccharide flippase family protein [Acinetobacter sp. YH16055]|uniref:oligosaccharide flippase family protein n=1 Tax=Acinetobacter sp. YH16055 TaxID=2601193 RepID=UPI0015D208BF|nr:oligosaccharide flippase family protein [Acinetobacter sp. YH16055]
MGFNTNRIKSASAWSFLEAGSNTLLGLVTIVFLARILEPNDYGKIATAQFISGFLLIILTLGISEIILQKKDLSQAQIQTFWTASIFLSFLSILICMMIGFIFLIQNQGLIGKILFFESINVGLSVLSIIPTALIFRELILKKFALRNIFTKLVFFIISVPLVFNGFGLWSVVYANSIQNIVAFIILIYLTKNYLPRKLGFNKDIFFSMINFGFFVMLENLLWSFLNRVLGILIAIFHGPAALGLYHMGTKLTDTILNILNTSITRITLPIFAQVQDDKEKLLYSFQSATYYFNMISIPIFVTFGMTADNWVPLLLGESWLSVLPIIQIISGMYAIMYTRMFVGVAVKAVGRSKDFLYLSFVAAIITLIVVFFTRNMNLETMLISLALGRIFLTIPLGMYLLNKICDINIKEQIKPVYIPVSIGLTLFFTFYFFNYFSNFSYLVGFSLDLLLFFLIVIVYFLFLKKKNLLKWNGSSS